MLKGIKKSIVKSLGGVEDPRLVEDKVIIILGGIGANFKSSITNHDAFKEFIRVPECNRALEKELINYGKYTDTALNFIVKKLVTMTLLRTKPSKVIMDRSLIDYPIMSEMIEKVLTHYSTANVGNLTVEKARLDEMELFEDYRVIPVLLKTLDVDFIKSVIDDKFDTRAMFYDNFEYYLKCQEIYETRFLEAHPDAIVIDIESVDTEDFERLIHDLIETILIEIK